MRGEKREPSGIVVELIDMAHIKAEMNEELNTTRGLGYESIDTHYDVGIVRTKKGIFALDRDGVGMSKPISESNPFFIGIYCSKEKNAIAIVPSFELKMTDKNIDTFKVVGQEPLEDFIRVFGSRLESNYHVWKTQLQKIGGKKRAVKVKT